MRLIGVFEKWEMDDGKTLTGVHLEANCIDWPCVLHRPTDHHMSEWHLHWRGDRGIFERLCIHGIGHPDPDQYAYWDAQGMESEGVHGCDGCCHDGS
jgi:hypothetical protein